VNSVDINEPHQAWERKQLEEKSLLAETGSTKSRESLHRLSCCAAHFGVHEVPPQACRREQGGWPPDSGTFSPSGEYVNVPSVLEFLGPSPD